MMHFIDNNDAFSLKEVEQRAGNCKSSDFPCKTVPKSVEHLKNAPPFSGHDLLLNGVFVTLDVELSKPFRCILLMLYSKYLNVISSSSAMHRPDLFTEDGGSIDSVSADTRYGISIVVNLRLVKRMYAELVEMFNPEDFIHEEAQEFCVMLKDILEWNSISLPDPILFESKDIIYYNLPPKREDTAIWLGFDAGYFSGGLYQFSLHTNLICAEQFLRYSDGILLAPSSVEETIYILKNMGREGRWGDNVLEINGTFTERQMLTVYAQRKSHKRPEWRTICNEFNKFRPETFN